MIGKESRYQVQLIEVEGAQTPPKMLTHFHRAWANSKKPIQSPAGCTGQGRPHRCVAPRRLPDCPRKNLLMKKPAVGIFHNSSRGKRSAWNGNQRLISEHHIKYCYKVSDAKWKAQHLMEMVSRLRPSLLGSFTQFKLFCILLHEIGNIV
jgi:hypothetical protein